MKKEYKKAQIEIVVMEKDIVLSSDDVKPKPTTWKPTASTSATEAAFTPTNG